MFHYPKYDDNVSFQGLLKFAPSERPYSKYFGSVFP